MAIVVNEFESTQQLNTAFAQRILSILADAIAKKGSASLVVSGGSTPKPLFKILSQQAFDWDKVSVTLADDRWVDANHNDSNEKLVKENLLVDKAANANFVSLLTGDADAQQAEAEISSRIDKLGDNLDVLILGMGQDGHTASLFPCSEQIESGLNLQRSLSAIATQPTTAPHQRMSMSLAKILQANNVFLHLVGDAKKDVLNDAVNNYTAIEKPIKAVCDSTTVNLMWAS